MRLKIFQVSDSQIITMTPVKKKETGAKSTN